ncbi:hypothetical protein [Saccharicrinis aurantiacus]|uniref:hypothetical protein n=1 Tax=Saccharicrinis aurantiacus TaxID=1849719 RepID=UPI0024900C99|nr:hypothetical protein [Saccharicrinis aurantiacus]
MARSLNTSLINKLCTGDYATLLDCIKRDSELAIEVRIHSTAIVYYQKSKVLTIHPRKEDPTVLDKGYWKNESKPILDLNTPNEYFVEAKRLVNEFSKKKNNLEFDIQQKIIAANNSIYKRYLVVDMEYQFAQNLLTDRTNKNTRFDLVAVDLEKQKIVLLELKQGLNALNGESGVDDHHAKFTEHINHPEFKQTLIDDVTSIINTKAQLGIYNFNTRGIINNLQGASVDFAYVFVFNTAEEQIQFKKQYKHKYDVIYIDATHSNFIL